MFAKSMLAATAIAATLTAFAPMQAAEAKTKVDIHVNIGGFYGDGYGSGYYTDPVPVYYEPVVTCGQGAKAVRWSGFRNVEPVDCSLPRYHYMAWKNHHQYLVTVNRFGDVTDWRPAY